MSESMGRLVIGLIIMLCYLGSILLIKRCLVCGKVFLSLRRRCKEQNARYVGRYVQKKMTGSWAKLKYGDREPEYGTMSRNPGIGARWIDAFKSEVFPSDAVVVRGGLFMPPRYYCSRVASSADGALLVDDVKLKRFMSRKRDEETVERLAVREQVALAEEALAREGGL